MTPEGKAWLRALVEAAVAGDDGAVTALTAGMTRSDFNHVLFILYLLQRPEANRSEVLEQHDDVWAGVSGPSGTGPHVGHTRSV